MSVDPGKIERLNALPPTASGAFVLYWVTSARVRHNPALVYAV